MSPGERTGAYFRRQRTVFGSTIDIAAAVGLHAAGEPIDPTAVAAGEDLPYDVAVEHGAVGGPSAGLLMALAFYDHAAAEDLAGGRRIAGTGTIAPDGAVGRIGSTAAKIVAAQRAGATLFLVPASQVDAARAAVDPSAPIAVIGVETFADAIAALRGT